MPTSGANFKFQDRLTNSNDEKSANNGCSENLPDRSFCPSSDLAVPLDNQNSEHISSVPQVVVKDDEHDLIELMVASSTIPVAPLNSNSSGKTRNDRTNSTGGSSRSDAKKRAKQQRDLSRDLALLCSDSNKTEDEKAFNFAQAYYLKVRDRLNEHSFMEFLKILNSFDNRSMRVSELYRKIVSILEPYEELSEEFVTFLLPEQAVELGVYMEYLCYTKMRHFLRKLEMYFNKQPQQVRKIYKCLSRLADQSVNGKIDMSTVRSEILPLLKGSSLLTEYFLQLFPYEQPPILECLDNKDFEKVDCGELDESMAGVQHEDLDNLDWETVDIPDTEDPFGGDSCPCSCHNNSVSSVSAHCFSCGIKFINGRVFIQNGKVLRPAKLVIEGANKKEIVERISKKPILKNQFDEKSGGTLRHRKRTAADSSPVKNSSGTSGNGNIGNSSLLSPTGTESEEDILDFKLPSAKIKSPRNLKSGSILKTSNKSITNKDMEKERPLRTDQLNNHSFVLLDDLNTISDGCKSDLKADSQENSADIVIKSESCDTEEVCIHKKLKMREYDVAESVVPSESSGSIDSILLRDYDDDDIEYIEIDDDDADDDVDIIEDEDDDDEDIEEDEEEIVHNEDDEEDYEDTEIIEIDEDDERDMEIDYISEINQAESNCLDYIKIEKNCSDNVLCNQESVKCDGSDATNNIFFNNAVTTVDTETSKTNLVQDIEVGIARKKFNDEINYTETESDSLVGEIPVTNEIQLPSSCEPSTNVHSSETINSEIKETKSPSPPSAPVLPPPQLLSTSTVTSWTKEEDKVILQTFQQESDTDENFIMITKQLPQRSVEEIKSRFNTLMQLLKRMTTNKNNPE